MADKRIADLFDKPIYFDPPDHPDDVILEASDAELSEGSRRRKRKDIEHAAEQYLKGRAPFLFSAQLKGTATKEKEWVSPWRKKIKARNPQLRGNIQPDRARETSRANSAELQLIKVRPIARSNTNARPKREHETKVAERQTREEKPGKVPLQRKHPSRGTSLSNVEEEPKRKSETNKKDRHERQHVVENCRSRGSSQSIPGPNQRQGGQLSAAVTAETKDMLPLSYHSNASTAATLPDRMEEHWLKRKLVSKKVWEGPEKGSTPTPKTIPVPTNKRKRRSRIVRTSISEQSSAAETTSKLPINGHKLQHRQYSGRGSFSDSHNSTGPTFKRQIVDLTTDEKPRELPLKRDSSARSTPVEDYPAINTVVTASTGKRMSSADNKQYSTMLDRQEYSMVDYSFDITYDTVDSKLGDSRIKTPDKIISTAGKVSREDFDESSIIGVPHAAKLGESAVTTPFSPQLGSFSKFRLMPKFDFDNAQSQISDGGGGFDFSFGDALKSQTAQPSMEPVSKRESPKPLFRQNNFGPEAPPLQQNQKPSVSNDQISSTIPAPKSTDTSFHHSRVQRADQKALESTQSRDKPREINLEAQEDSRLADKTLERRLRRSMPFDDDDSPGFHGPRQKRHREKTKLKKSQLQEQRESSDSSWVKVENMPSKKEKILSRPELNREVSLEFEPGKAPGIVIEPPRVTLSSVIRVNQAEEPIFPDNFVQSREVEAVSAQGIEKPSHDSLKFVISAIITEHITPEKPSNLPRSEEKKISTTNRITPSRLPPEVSTANQKSFVNSDISPLVSKSKSSVFSNVPTPRSNIKPPLSPLSNPSTPLKSSKSRPTSPEKEQLTKSPPTPMLLDEAFLDDQQAPQKPMAHDISQQTIEDDAVHSKEAAIQLENDAVAYENFLTSSSRPVNPIRLESVSNDAEVNVDSTSPPQSNPESSAVTPANSERKTLLPTSLMKVARSKNASPLRPHHSSSNSQGTNPKAWSFNDTTLSLSSSRVDSSTPMVSPRKVKTPISRSKLSKVGTSVVGESESFEHISGGLTSTSVQLQDKRGPAVVSEKKIEEFAGKVPDAEDLMFSPIQEQNEVESATPLSEKKPSDFRNSISDANKLASTSSKEKDNRGSSTASSKKKLRDRNGESPIGPIIIVEDVVVSSDDEEEDIPSSRPAPISALRDSFLSPRKKWKKQGKPRRKTTGKVYKSIATSSDPQTPKRSRKVNSQTKSPIQAIDEDPMTAEEARLYAEFEAEPQSPWNVATEAALPPVLAIPALETPSSNAEGKSFNGNALPRSSSSRVPSELQTGWDESGFGSVSGYIATDMFHDAPDSDILQQEANVSHDTSYELLEWEVTPLKKSSRPLMFTTPSPPQLRKPTPTPQQFPNTQTLINAAINNPWITTSSMKKSTSKKRVSFATDNEDIAGLPSHRPEKKQRLTSPPPTLPPVSDDSIGIDGTDDKLARKLRAITTLKYGLNHASSSQQNLSSSPAADAMANAFINADLLQKTGLDSFEKRKRRHFEEHGDEGFERAGKRIYRPSQASYVYDDDDDEEWDRDEEAAASFEITPDGDVTTVKNSTSNRTRNKSRSKSKSPNPNIASVGNKSSALDEGKNENTSSILGGEAKEEDIAAMVEKDPDQVLGDVQSFLEGWDVEEEVRRVGGVDASSSTPFISKTTATDKKADISSSASARKRGSWFGILSR